MARYSTEHKARTRTRILEAADRVMKSQGVESASVEAVMREAGLTVGRDNRLSIERDGQRISLTIGTSYFPVAAPINDAPEVASAELPPRRRLV